MCRRFYYLAPLPVLDPIYLPLRIVIGDVIKQYNLNIGYEIHGVLIYTILKLCHVDFDR
jgi:hypothetical protein